MGNDVSIINESVSIACKLTTSRPMIAKVGSKKKMMVIYSNIANIDGKNPVDISVSWRDDDRRQEEIFLHYTVAIPADAALTKSLCGLLLEEGDAIYAQASSEGSANLTLTFFEV